MKTNQQQQQRKAFVLMLDLFFWGKTSYQMSLVITGKSHHPHLGQISKKEV